MYTSMICIFTFQGSHSHSPIYRGLIIWLPLKCIIFLWQHLWEQGKMWTSMTCIDIFWIKNRTQGSPTRKVVYRQMSEWRDWNLRQRAFKGVTFTAPRPWPRGDTSTLIQTETHLPTEVEVDTTGSFYGGNSSFLTDSIRN